MKRVVKVKWFNLFLMIVLILGSGKLICDFFFLILDIVNISNYYQASIELILFGFVSLSYGYLEEEMEGE